MAMGFVFVLQVVSDCCAFGANASFTALVRESLALYTEAVAACFKGPRASSLPVVIATSMGKGYTAGNATDWILHDFMNSMPEMTFVLGHVRSPWRELAAAAELRVVSGARNFVGAYSSTFSRFAAARVSRAGGRAALLDLMPEDSPLRTFDKGKPPPPREQDMLGRH
eukprot:6206260-Pleurochrysis_carterae.AAC.2